MKTQNNQGPFQAIVFLQSYGYWLGVNSGKAFLGSIWLGVSIAFVMFFVEYYRFWHRGVRLGQRDYLMAFEDLERKSRRISVAFIMYFMMSYILLVLFTNGFLDCVARGAILSAVVFPLANVHYSQKEKYQFKTH